MSAVSITTVSDIFKMLSDPTRLRIFILLFSSKKRELCVSDIAKKIGASHSATSHQLAKLEQFGLVVCYRRGQMVCYRMKKKKICRQIQKMIGIIKKI